MNMNAKDWVDGHGGSQEEDDPSAISSRIDNDPSAISSRINDARLHWTGLTTLQPYRSYKRITFETLDWEEVSLGPVI